MPKMSNVQRVISMTNSNSWRSLELRGRLTRDILADFCLNCCPHQDVSCKGDCAEMKEFRRKNRRRKK